MKLITSCGLIVVSLCMAEAVSASDQLDSWSASNSGTQNELNGITYGNGQFIIIGAFGTVLTSPDGSTWTQRSAGTQKGSWAVAFGNGQFVSVGEGIVTSSDALEWTERYAGTNNSILFNVTYGNGHFVAVGGGQKATVVSSADGVNWTPWYWTPQDPLFDPYTFTGVAFGNGKFVAVSAGNGGPRSVATSPDGIAWAQAEGAGPHYAGTLTFGNGLFVAAGEYYSSANNILISHSVIYTSQDGVNWAQQADKAIESVLFSS